MAKGVANLNLALHVMDDHVHVSHGPSGGCGFLAVELERDGFLLANGPGLFLQRQFALDEQAGGATGGVVASHTRLGVHDERHDLAHLAGRVELARALPAAFGEFTDEILVAAPDDVRLYITKAEALFADAFNLERRLSSMSRMP